jgi:hypothetical protein
LWCLEALLYRAVNARRKEMHGFGLACAETKADVGLERGKEVGWILDRVSSPAGIPVEIGRK